MNDSFNHQTVLLQETVDALGDIKGKTVVDCTMGGGGHTNLLLERVGPEGRVIAFDRDEDALAHGSRRFAGFISTGHLEIIDRPFSDLKNALESRLVFGKIGGLIADIGVSSHQIDRGERGFSFMHDGPLDMRMDPRSGISAAQFLNEESEELIAHVIWSLGEEVKSRHIARLIIAARAQKPFKSTLDLANLISRAHLWKGHSKKHPATKTFQALRIYVNDELKELSTLLEDGFEALEVGAKFAVISFHSLEDRIVKDKFHELCGKSQRNALPRDIPFTAAEIDLLVKKRGEIVGKFPSEPSPAEISFNPRSRSAKLRTIHKTSK